MIYDKVLGNINEGKFGRNQGLPNGFDRINQFIFGVQKGTYYVIGGEPGTGKSALVDHMFMYSPFNYLSTLNKEKELKILYFSLELSKEIKITKAIARRIYDKHNIVTDVNYILSRGKNRVSSQMYDLVKKERDYFQKLEDRIVMLDGSFSPGDIKMQLDKYFLSNKDNKYNIIIIDHIGLIKATSNQKKAAIDEVSRQLVFYRNQYNCIPVVVQQLNRTMSSIDRFKLDRVEPQLSDFKDTGNTQEDANIVLSIFSPLRYKLDTYRGYNVNMLKDRFRAMGVLKNRDGEADKVIGIKFLGEMGYFKELPIPSLMTDEDYDKIIKT